MVNWKLIIGYCNRNALTKEKCLMYSDCWEEEGPVRFRARALTSQWNGRVILLRVAGSGPAQRPAADWTRTRPIRFLLCDIWKRFGGDSGEPDGFLNSKVTESRACDDY